MKGIDYSDRLNSIKERYYNDIQKTRENNEENIEALKEQHQKKEEAQASNYRKSKLDLEEDFRNHTQRVNKETKKIMAQRNKEFRERLADQRDEFNEQRDQIKTEVNRKLTNLNDSYDRVLKTERELNSQLQGQTKENFNQKIQQNKNAHHGDLRKVYKQFDKEIDALREKEKLGREKLIKQQDAHLGEVVRENTKRQLLERENNRTSVNNLRNSFNTELENTQKNKETQLKDKTRLHQNKIEDLKENFANLGNRLREEQIDEKNRIAKQARDQITLVNKQNSKEKQILRNELRRAKQREAAQFSGFKKQLEQSEINRYENQINSLSNEISDVKKQMRDKQADQSDLFATTLKQRSIAAAAKRDDLIRENGIEKAKAFEASQNEISALTENFQRDQIQSRKENTEQLLNQEKQLKNQIKRSDKRSIEIRKRLEEDNEGAIQTMRDTFAKQKSTLIKSHQKDRAEYGSRLRDENNLKTEKLIEKYEKKLEDANLNLEKTVQNYEDSLDNLQKRLQKEQVRSNELVRSKEDEHQREIVRLTRAKDVESDNRVRAIKHQYEKKLNETAHENQKKIKHITRVNQDKIDRLNNDHFVQKTALNNMRKAELEKMANNFMLEKQSIIDKYENQIMEMKRNNEAYLEKIKAGEA